MDFPIVFVIVSCVQECVMKDRAVRKFYQIRKGFCFVVAEKTLKFIRCLSILFSL